ncbi:MAG: hypothetical protein JNL17_09935 [Cyclobacteriaceae bacterium]|nr:hypothetical protein [Cyclobacteriaceae bacterium]
MSNKKLNDPTLPIELEPITWENPELIEETIANKKVSFVLGADAKLGVSVFNAESDTDPSEVFGKAGALIPFQANRAWLKYAAACNIKVKGGLDIKSVGFEMDVAAGLQAYVYRKHDATQLLKEAQARDINSIKTIFSKTHIRDLDIDEAVGLEFAGKLGASIAVSWSDVWTSQLSVLSDLLDTNELIKLKVGPEASIKTSIQLEDAFRVQLVKTGRQKYQLWIKRNQSKKWSSSISINVGVKIENPEVITDRLDSLFQEVFEVSFAKLNDLVKKKASTLSESEKLIIKAIANRLGWNESTAFDQLKEKIETLYETLHKKVETAVTKKVEAGFKYEYLRVAERDDLFSATVTDSGLDEFHQDIIRANVTPLIHHALQQPSSALLNHVKFLREDVKKRQRSSGFSLGFGKWVASNRNKISMMQTTRTTEKGVQVAYHGQRSYEDGVGSSKRQWLVDFNAEMPQVSNQPVTPLASEFNYSLNLQYEWTEKRLKPANLDSFLDLCRLWNVISDGQWTTLRTQLESDLDHASAITYSCTALYPHELFRVMIAAMGNSSAQLDSVFYQSLGAALPYWAPFPVRMDVEKKATHYAPIWREFIETESVNPQEIAAQHLKDIDKKLAAEELNYAPNQFINFQSFAFAAKHNAQTLRRWKSFREGVSELSKAIDRQALQVHDPLVNQCFQKMEDLWLFPLHAKAFGNYLARIADQYPTLRAQAVRTAKISYTKKDKDQVLIIGRT